MTSRVPDIVVVLTVVDPLPESEHSGEPGTLPALTAKVSDM
jgi:hypothetical protein